MFLSKCKSFAYRFSKTTNKNPGNASMRLSFFSDLQYRCYCLPVSGSTCHTHFLFEKICVQFGLSKTVWGVYESLLKIFNNLNYFR